MLLVLHLNCSAYARRKGFGVFAERKQSQANRALEPRIYLSLSSAILSAECAECATFAAQASDDDDDVAVGGTS